MNEYSFINRGQERLSRENTKFSNIFNTSNVNAELPGNQKTKVRRAGISIENA